MSLNFENSFVSAKVMIFLQVLLMKMFRRRETWGTEASAVRACGFPGLLQHLTTTTVSVSCYCSTDPSPRNSSSLFLLASYVTPSTCAVYQYLLHPNFAHSQGLRAETYKSSVALLQGRLQEGLQDPEPKPGVVFLELSF